MTRLAFKKSDNKLSPSANSQKELALSDTTPPTWIVDLLLPHPTLPQILMVADAAGWCLPRLQILHVQEGQLRRIKAEVRQQLGIDVHILRLLSERHDEPQHEIRQTFFLEYGSAPAAQLLQGSWVGVEQAPQLNLRYAEQQPLLEAWHKETESGETPALRTPWARPGWRAQADEWIQAQLQQLGYQVNGPLEEVRNWILSYVLRAPTGQGLIYFKTSGGSSLFVNEAVATAALAQRFSGQIPTPLCVDADRNWMLLADFGAEVGWKAPLEVRSEALAAFARLQIASVQQFDTLKAIGCSDRRLDKLAAQVDPLLNDPAMLAYVNAAEGARLRAVAPQLKALCHQLASYNVPYTLVHGDIHMGNIAHPNSTFLFFDWTDACIAHPFLDMIDILLTKDSAAQTQLRDRYLAEWTAYEPMERLLAMWSLVYPLCALHQAVSYQQIIAHCEPAARFTMDGAMALWFGKILESM